MAKDCILSIDQGTTGSRVYVFDATGRILANEYEEFTQYFPNPAWMEHDPEEIWDSVQKLLIKALKKSGRKASHVQGIGITNQRETALIWDRKTGRPIYRAIVWQCRRTAGRCDELKAQGHGKIIQSKTGLVVDAYFSGTKFEWILDHVDGAREKSKSGNLAGGTIDAWLLFKLTGEHATDYTNASRTLLYDIEKKDWDNDLLELIRVPSSLLPKVYPSRHHFGKVISVRELGGVPVLAMIGDQQAALFGQLCVDAGEAKNTYGTGAFLLFHTGKRLLRSQSGIITTLACNADGQVAYALEGSVFIAGAVMQWLRDSLSFFKNVADSENIFKDIEDTPDEVVFVPAFAGLGAPHWDMQARGGILGLSRETSMPQIIRAALKSIALQSYELVEAMEKDTGQKLDILRVDGGASANGYLMQYQADILNKKIERPPNLDTTALGSAYLAGMEAGMWSLSDLRGFQAEAQYFSPSMDEERRSHELAYWRQGVERVRDWSHS